MLEDALNIPDIDGSGIDMHIFNEDFYASLPDNTQQSDKHVYKGRFADEYDA